MPNRAIAGFRLQPKLGEQVATYGFPLEQILAAEGNFTLGNVPASPGLVVIRGTSKYPHHYSPAAAAVR
jgi:hypothetical protein